MEVLVVTVICIALIVVGGMTLSHGILASTDTTALNIDKLTVREGDIARTDLTVTRSAQLYWGDYLRVTVKNTGQTRLANFDKWDVIVNYTDESNNLISNWLPYTSLLTENNKWYKARIGLDGPIEYYNPGILDPSEEMVLFIHLNPPPQVDTNINVSVATPNGVYSALSTPVLSHGRFTAESENVTLGNVKYYELVEASPADGIPMIASATFSTNESGKKLLYNVNQPDRATKHVYPLIGITQIPASTWIVYYHGFVGGYGAFPRSDGDTCYCIDIVVRKADGSIRDILDQQVAIAFVAAGEGGYWLTFNSNPYHFKGYTVVDPNDYLEIDYYGLTKGGPNAPLGYIKLSMDDDTLSVFDQTRIEVYQE